MRESILALIALTTIGAFSATSAFADESATIDVGKLNGTIQSVIAEIAEGDDRFCDIKAAFDEGLTDPLVSKYKIGLQAKTNSITWAPGEPAYMGATITLDADKVIEDQVILSIAGQLDITTHTRPITALVNHLARKVLESAPPANPGEVGSSEMDQHLRPVFEKIAALTTLSEFESLMIDLKLIALRYGDSNLKEIFEHISFASERDKGEIEFFTITYSGTVTKGVVIPLQVAFRFSADTISVQTMAQVPMDKSSFELIRGIAVQKLTEIQNAQGEKLEEIKAAFKTAFTALKDFFTAPAPTQANPEGPATPVSCPAPGTN